MVTALAVLSLLSQAPQEADAGNVLPPAPPTHHEASPVPAADAGTATVAEEEHVSKPRAEENQAGVGGANPPTAILGEWWKKVHPFGYVKAGVFYTFPLQNEQLVGGNGGFRVLAARLGIELNLVEDLQVVTSIEIAAPNMNPADPLTGGRIVEARDAYLEYRVARFLIVRAGQFKAPFNAETLLGDADIPFITRSVMTDGVAPPQAYGPRDGLTLGRQIGLQLFSERLGGESFSVRYLVAAVNGNGQNQLFNDSNPIAPVARVELELFKRAILGLNGFYNVVSQGVRPNRLNVNQLGYGADLQLRFGDFRALLGFVGRNNSYTAPDTGSLALPSDMSMGFVGQGLYVFESLGLEAAARFGWYEPSTALTADRVWNIDALIAYRFSKVPLRVLVQYTHREEESGVTIPNDSFDAMVQATW